MNFLVDTDVLSEPSKPRPSPKVEAWFETNQALLHTSAITIGELTHGIELLPAGARRTQLERWLEHVLAKMTGRILAYNTRVGQIWGVLMADLERQGRKMPLADSYIAAIGKRHNLTLATHNSEDYSRVGIRVFNPFL